MNLSSIDRTTGVSLGSGNAFGFGVGGRIGYTWPSHVYFGAIVLWHKGYHDENTIEPGGALSHIVRSDVRVLHGGLELGYGFGDAPIVRPSIEVGAISYSAKASSRFDDGSGLDGDVSTTALVVGPGVTILYPFADRFHAGGDARLFVASKTDISGLSLMATIGVRL